MECNRKPLPRGDRRLRWPVIEDFDEIRVRENVEEALVAYADKYGF